ncbi:sensor histidine kinase [Alicyclobacillaceae bacterium I2511]|nr:sensor histidine kinase [Alicyclobacillaceae bacterium I2511]
MKLKVAVFTGLILSLILLAFNTFIYFTLNNHLISNELTALSSRAETIAQSYQSHINEGQSPGFAGAYEWLHRFDREGQRVALLSPKGTVLVQMGTATLPLQTVAAQFHPAQQGAFPLRSYLTPARNLAYVSDITPVFSDEQNKVLGYVVILSSTAGVREYMHTLLAVLITGSIGAILLAMAAGYLVSALAVRPINQMIRKVSQIQANSLNERVRVPHGHDEVVRLAVTFNRMLARIQQSFAQQSRFVADASHEIRTPLTIILGYAALLNRWGKADPTIVQKAIEVIQRESHRLQELTEDLLILAGLEIASEATSQATLLDPVISSVLDTLAPLHPALHLQTHLNAPEAVQFSGTHLKQVVYNLIDNAIKYTPEQGTVRVETARSGNEVQMRVTDTGPGIPPEDLPHIFERFYRVDKARMRSKGGNGLGLAIVHELVNLYGGTISAASVTGQGTVMTVRFRTRVRESNTEFFSHSPP